MREKKIRTVSKHSITRRQFLKGVGSSAVASAAIHAEGLAEQLERTNRESVNGPEAVPITLMINGREKRFVLEPRVTLLDLLRNHSTETGAKEVCDRATCGACTVLLDGSPIYSCMILAIEAQDRSIKTVEGLAKEGRLSKLQEAFVKNDSLMCGYCTPGFIMSLSALLEANPHPNEAEVREACSGNLCRCGTYPRVFDAALDAAGVKTTSKTKVLSLKDA